MRIEDVREGMKVVFNRVAADRANAQTVGRDVVPLETSVIGEVVQPRHENRAMYSNISQVKLPHGTKWWYDASLFDPLNQEDF